MPPAQFVSYTPRVTGGGYLFMNGVNREDSALAADDSEFDVLGRLGLLKGGKNVVEAIQRIAGANEIVWRITLPRASGRGPRHIEVTTGSSVESFPAGGALNAAFVANSLGLASHKIFLCGPIGRGGGGDFLVENIKSRGIRHALYPSGAGGTATTLSVHNREGHSTLFTLKPSYHVERRAQRFLEEVAAEVKVVCALSVKPSDLDLALRMWRHAPQNAELVFGPHASLLKRRELTDKWLPLAKAAKLCIMNDAEASFLVKRRFRREDIRAIATQLGAAVVVVTMGKAGAVMQVRGEPAPYWQPAMTPEAAIAGTSGAGDTLTGGMIAGLFDRGLPPRQALRLGTLAASFKVTSRCPWGGIPELEEFDTIFEIMD